MFMARRIASVLLLCLIATGIEGLQVGFGEVDYSENEGTKSVSVVVQKKDRNIGKLVLTIQTLTYDELEASLRPTEVALPDPAEFEQNGRQDFIRNAKTVTFDPSDSFEEKNVILEFLDDDINEATEGYFALLRVDEESSSNSEDMDKLEYIRDGVTLIVINDDDDIKLSFGSPRYEVNETTGIHERLITIVKENDKKTEQDLQVFVQLSPLSGDSEAENGKDFRIAETKTLKLSPEEQMVYVPFESIDDNITEFRERFRLSLSIPEGEGKYSLGSIQDADVFILDNEVGRVGFESIEYIVTESVDPTVEVCVKIFDDQFEYFLFGNIVITGNSAQASIDYFSPLATDIFLDSTTPRQCFTINIVDDVEIESTESLTVNISIFEDTEMSLNIDPITTTVLIQDNDQIQVNPCDLCGENAECVESAIEGVLECVCMRGYRGDGVQCDNINECLEGTHNCHANADCTDLTGSYSCACKVGYSGNGFICTDIDECLQGTNNCHENARCINLIGSYRCQCKSGYSGNGFICKDIDECKTGANNCHERASCINTPGSYRCVCNDGYTGNGLKCDKDPIDVDPDINECKTRTDNCSPFAKCTNTIGSFTCTCKEGFTGNGVTCKDKNECTDGSHKCDRNAVCFNRYFGAGYYCRCKYGYKGNGFTCSKKQAEPTLPPTQPTDGTDDCDDGTRSRSTRGRSRSTRGRSRSTRRSRSRSTSSSSSCGGSTRSTSHTHTRSRHTTHSRSRRRG